MLTLIQQPPHVPSDVWDKIDAEAGPFPQGGTETERLHIGGLWHGEIHLHIDQFHFFIGHPGGTAHYWPKSGKWSIDVKEKIRMTSWVYEAVDVLIDGKAVGILKLYGHRLTAADYLLVSQFADRGAKTTRIR